MRRLFIYSSWLPPVVWIAAWIDLRHAEGWGAWAAASGLVPIYFASVAWGACGLLLLVVKAVRERRLDRAVLVATLVSGGVALYYLPRILFR